ncbi:uncharacterized protein LOC131845999 isoform X1 [Achroia grisella]|uniref:uncharacterized protein LOC131845999 isoform X1 n=2 Tax=Achroia grisella TaxID=688607 RepID=UPI0027D33B03|nr:uncharacterized protein LOC131845999 isoform X1 [Achroia grisella]
MNKLDKEFITDMFLDSDAVFTINRLILAVANVINENSNNMNNFSKGLNEELKVMKIISKDFIGKPATHTGVNSYYEHTIQNFDDFDYINRFKMKKTTVQALINFLADYVSCDGTVIVPLAKKVHIFLWILTSDASYQEIGSKFGLHKSSVSYIFQQIASVLTDQRYHFISWPSIEEQHMTRLKVNSRFKFPNCVGFLDACRFKVGSKNNKSNMPDNVLMQAVCDESLMFIDIHIGTIGKTKKSKVFRESQLSRELKNFIDFDNHILGDSEYKLKKNLITPFSSEELLTSEEMKFNEVHWKVRYYIGHAFELLKDKFRRLNHIDICKPEIVTSLIYSACVLHNFLLLHEGYPEMKEEAIICDDGVTIDTSIVKTAVEKRQFLCNYINYIDVDNE